MAALIGVESGPLWAIALLMVLAFGLGAALLAATRRR